MKYDKPLIACSIGAISTIISEIITQSFVLSGIGKYSIYQLISLVITINRPTEIIGMIVNFIIGGFLGVVFYYALGIIGADYLVIKSFAASLIFWFFSEMIFTAVIEGRYIEVRPVIDYYIHLAGASCYGIAVGLLFEKYLFQNAKSG